MSDLRRSLGLPIHFRLRRGGLFCTLFRESLKIIEQRTNYPSPDACTISQHGTPGRSSSKELQFSTPDPCSRVPSLV
jgi:hypothetical protein